MPFGSRLPESQRMPGLLVVPAGGIEPTGHVEIT